MKKTIALILAVILCLALLTACGDKSGGKTGDYHR